jgi:hypothetical protein
MKNLKDIILEKLRISVKSEIGIPTFEELHKLILDNGDDDFAGRYVNFVYSKNCFGEDTVKLELNGKEVEVTGIFALIHDNTDILMLNILTDDSAEIDELRLAGSFNKKRYQDFLEVVGIDNVITMYDYLMSK